VNRREHVREVGRNVTEYLQKMGDAEASDNAVSPEFAR